MRPSTTFIAPGICALLLVSCIRGNQTGKSCLRSAECDETSGITASAVHENVLYIHNDSGDINRFFAIDTTGKLLSTCFYTPAGSDDLYSAADCEDIATGPGPVPGKSYVYIGDIGDNTGKRPFVTIYRIEEPATFSTFVHCKSDTINLYYPDGPRDAETLMIDPLSLQMYIISKRENTVGIYAAPLIPKNGEKVVLKRKGGLRFAGNRKHKWITSGDISHDGTRIVLRSYNKVYSWMRLPGEPVERTMKRPPVLVGLPQEPDGEAICFSSDGKSLFSTSEGRYAVLNQILFPQR